MSHIRWVPPPSDTLPPGARSLWRFFPLGVVAAMSVVIAVNAGMIYSALHTFPGAAGGDEGFALSNNYNAVLEQSQREAALGWNMQASTDQTGRPVVTLADRDGAPLRGASVAASAERPLGATQTLRLTFHEAGAGQYVADTPLTLPGQWDLTLSASTGGHDIAATRRIIVR
jgi:nitrogen fixation protein FixH